MAYGRRVLVNAYEAATDEALQRVASKYGARVLPKVRVIDAFGQHPSSLASDEFDFALRAHFDFLIVDRDTCPLFAVEFDGPSHHTDPGTIRRDKLKNTICDKLGLPLLRIGDDFFRRVGRFVLLGWLVEVWFLNDAFNAAQEAGDVPNDEIFHYSFILGFAYRDGDQLVEVDDLDAGEQLRLLREHEANMVVTQPYDPFIASRAFISRAFRKGICREPVPKEVVGIDRQGFHAALAILHVEDDAAVVGTARVRSFRFPPISPQELAIELSVVDAADKLKQYQQGRYTLLTTGEFQAWEDRIVKDKIYS